MNQSQRTSSRLLLVDPEGGFSAQLSDLLSGSGYQCKTASGVGEALERLGPTGESVAAILLLHGRAIDALPTLRVLRSRTENLPILVIDAEPSIPRGIEVMKQGAADYLSRPDLTGKLLTAALSKSIELASLDLQQRRLDARVAYAGRLANVAQFSAGVTSELNRSMAVIVANLSFLKDHVGSMQRYLQETHRLLQRYVAPEDQARLAKDLVQHADFLIQGSEAAGAVEDSIQATRGVQRIVHDLKVLSPMGEEEPMTEQDPRALVESVVDLLYPLIALRARLELDFESVPGVKVQRARVAQVILNILLNAIEAIPEGRPGDHRIRIKMRSTERDVHITVRDTGVGIEPENISKVFRPFFSTRRPGRGAGLGLSVANQVMLEHGGRITLNSTPGEGTIVVITIPVEGRDNLSPLASGAVRKLVRAPMLMIDPDRAVLDSYARLYGSVARVETAYDLEEAWNHLKAGRLYDLIIVDLALPQGGAVQLLQRTIDEGLHSHLDRWVFSSRDLGEDSIEEDGRVMGYEVLQKPLSFELIMKRLSEI